MKPHFLSMVRSTTVWVFVGAAAMSLSQQAPAQEQAKVEQLGGPAKKELREQYTPADFENFLQNERSGQVPSQGGAVGAGLTGDALVNNNTGATGTSNFTQSETSISAFGNTVVVTFNDAGSNSGGASKFTGFAYSNDGGVTFTDGGTLPTSAGGDAGDPVIARDETTGRLYFSTLGFNSPGNIQMWRSDDNGVTWMPPVNATPGGSNEDKQWHTVDNFAGSGNGNVYLLTRNFASGNGIFFYRSVDGGATFAPSGGILIVAGNQGAFVTVGPDHAVYAFWYAGTTLQVRKSTDQGLTFGAPVTVASGLAAPGVNGDLGLTGLRQGTATFGAFRSNSFPHVAVNPVSGHLYVTYNDNPAGADKADVFLVLSADGGATWSAPVRVNDDATTTDQWQPTIAVTPDGATVGIFYYSRQEDPVNNNLFKYYGRTGVITGSSVTFFPGFAVSEVASFPEFGRDAIVNSVYMGDYNHAVATGGAFHVVWSDNRDDLAGGAGRKDPNVYYEKIPAGLLSGPNISVTPTNVDFGGVPVGQTAGPVLLSLTNTGNATVTVTGITSPSGDFSSTPPGLPLLIPSTGTATFPVSFSPLSVGVQNTSFTITSDAVNNPTVTVNLSGRGFIPAANDLCANAIPLSCGGSVDGNTDNATADTVVACSGVVVAAPGLWYTVTGTGAPLTLSTCSAASYDTRISVYSGACGSLVCVTANDDFCAPRSQVTFASADGATYYVLVHGTGGQTGTFTLTESACPALVSLTPPALDFTLAPNGTGSTQLTVANTAAPGALDLNWSLVANSAGPVLSTSANAIVVDPAWQEPLFRVTDRVVQSLRQQNVPFAFLSGIEALRTAPALDKETFLNEVAALPEAPQSAQVQNLMIEQSAIMRSEIKDVPGAIGGKAAALAVQEPRGFSPEGSGGPDGFGYEWVDSNEPGGPVFSWIDITGTGTSVTLGDDAGIKVPLGMTFSFYGVNRDSVTISSNGFLTFGSVASTFTNAAIPTATNPNDIICPFWDDLNPALGGTIHYLATDSQFVVQYTNVVRFGTSTPETFQAVLSADGSMLFQYLDMQGIVNSATVGTENAAGTIGLQVVFNASYVQNNLAVRIATPAPCSWITSVVPSSGTVAPGGSQAALVSVDAAGLTAGSSYQCEIVVTSNAANGGRLIVPVSLTVSDATDAPVVAAPILEGATAVSGSSTEANGTVITLYVNSDSVGSTTVTGNVWTVTGLTALVAGDSVKATATAASELTSGFSNLVIVASVTAAPVVNGPIVAGATSVSGTSTEANGTSIEAFVNGGSVGTTTVTGGTWTKSGLAALSIGDAVKAKATASGKLESGFSNTVIVTPPGSSVNVVANPGFESGTAPWQFFTNGTGSFATVAPGAPIPGDGPRAGAGGNVAARVIVTTTGSNIQLYQSGLTLQAATLYRLTFKARSSTGRNLAVHLSRHDSPYTDYGLNGAVFDLTTSWQTFSIDFTTINFPPPSPSNGRLRFRLNGFAAAGDQYFIDDVVLEALPGGGPVATKINVETAANGTGSIVPAQTVEPGDSIRVYAIARDAANSFVGNVAASWSLLNITGSVVAGDLVPAGDNKSAWFIGAGAGTAQIRAASAGLTPTPSGTITVPTPPPTPNLVVNGGFEAGTSNWTFQTNGTGTFSAVVPGNVGTKAGQVAITAPGTTVQLFQKDIPLTAGNTYRLSFKATSTTGHDVSVSVFKHGSPFTPYGLASTVFNLTNAWASYSVDFTASGFVGSASDARLRFWFSPYDAAGDVYAFDDIRVELLPVPSIPSAPAVAEMPKDFTLGANFPNPFNPSTTIIYTLPVDAYVTLEVYDVLGRRVAELVDGASVAGYHDVTFDASALASGLYIYRITATAAEGLLFSETRKMVLTK